MSDTKKVIVEVRTLGFRSKTISIIVICTCYAVSSFVACMAWQYAWPSAGLAFQFWLGASGMGALLGCISESRSHNDARLLRELVQKIEARTESVRELETPRPQRNA